SSPHHRGQLSFPTRRSSDLVSPSATSADPSAWGRKPSSNETGRVWSGARPSDRTITRGLRHAFEKHLGVHGGATAIAGRGDGLRSEEHTSELQSRVDLVCRL